MSNEGKTMNKKTECAKCTRVVCESDQTEKALPTCPMKTKPKLVKEVADKYIDPNVKEFARQASIQEFECYMRLPEGTTPNKPRILETVEFAKKMGYKKLGLAFCVGLRNEAKIVSQILENKGFEVISVCCKVGGIPKEFIGITDEQKIKGPGSYEVMCNPIAQAEILNREKTEFNVLVGLCVGHDALFLQNIKSPTTVLIAKDRVLGHNPAAALYLSSSYYKKLLRK
jgi:uncharacterized metal-binding protein